tara:strand:- start:14 stop:451 length:438 start_codon:yes stop_codon:yes gene_type:complete
VITNNLTNLDIPNSKKIDTNRVSKIISTFNNKFLMLQKKNGQFELPGGHIQRGESPNNGAKREFFEETGVNIKKINQISSNSSRVLYRGYINTSIIKLSSEHKSFRFVSERELFKLPLSKWSKKDLAFLKPRKKTTDEEELDDEI